VLRRDSSDLRDIHGAYRPTSPIDRGAKRRSPKLSYPCTGRLGFGRPVVFRGRFGLAVNSLSTRPTARKYARETDTRAYSCPVTDAFSFGSFVNVRGRPPGKTAVSLVTKNRKKVLGFYSDEIDLLFIRNVNSATKLRNDRTEYVIQSRRHTHTHDKYELLRPKIFVRNETALVFLNETNKKMVDRTALRTLDTLQVLSCSKNVPERRQCIIVIG